MKKKSLIYLMFLFMSISFLMSLYYIANNIYLSIILFSGGIFFIFLSKNPALLMATSISEIDEIIPKLKGKTYLIGSFVILVINILFL